MYGLMFSIPASGDGSFLLLGKPLKSRDHTTPKDFCTHAKTHLHVHTHNPVNHSDLGLLQMMQVENKEGFKSRSRGSAASTTQVGASGPLSLHHRHSREMSPTYLPCGSFWLTFSKDMKCTARMTQKTKGWQNASLKGLCGHTFLICICLGRFSKATFQTMGTLP